MSKLSCILLVDDDQTTNFLNQLLLKKLGIAEQILVAQDGQEALNMLTQPAEPQAPTYPALILLDVNMPGMNGIQFLEAYQQMPLSQQQAIVIIMLTTSLHPRDVERVQRLSIVTDFVSKPLTAEKMQAILQNHF
ncbi:response regulator [Hymenobacter crusticola]|uniref:Response regulator n=1 Tax=Hymenobacter crusticola TaxID=1770526 RepID=A0A243WAL3_9BACT|nr:response regulator [Hymenobacter crusticola]OUJ72613.1 response regulator [Hymenobacter crusticola]